MFELHFDGYTLSDDPGRIDLAVVHGFLTTSYWATGISKATVERSITHSMPFGIYRDHDGRQIGFARVITDRTSYGYLADVFVVEGERGRGLARWMVKGILSHPDLQDLRRWGLVTRDAQPVYQAAGFVPLAAPDRHLELVIRKSER